MARRQVVWWSAYEHGGKWQGCVGGCVAEKTELEVVDAVVVVGSGRFGSTRSRPWCVGEKVVVVEV